MCIEQLFAFGVDWCSGPVGVGQLGSARNGNCRVLLFDQCTIQLLVKSHWQPPGCAVAHVTTGACLGVHRWQRPPGSIVQRSG
jgi:hypothetical protein